MTRFLSYFSSDDSSKTDALEDAYRIHGDGVATMIPEKLVQRPEFQRILQEIDDLDIRSEESSSNE